MSSGIYPPRNTIKFAVLGPMLVRAGGAAVRVSSERQRTLLATLLANSNHIVSIEYLADSLWNCRSVSPSSARANIYSYVMRLRRTLGPDLGLRISTCDRGYIINVNPGEFDVIEFARHAQAGKRALDSGALDVAFKELEAALDLWRGEPYADISSEILQRDEAALLQEQRLIVLEWQIDTELHLGHYGEVIPRLRRLTVDYPLQEKFAAQFMLALSLAGRRGEALAAFDTIRHDLADELGLDPGDALISLQMQILTGHHDTVRA